MEPTWGHSSFEGPGLNLVFSAFVYVSVDTKNHLRFSHHLTCLYSWLITVKFLLHNRNMSKTLMSASFLLVIKKHMINGKKKSWKNMKTLGLKQFIGI